MSLPSTALGLHMCGLDILQSGRRTLANPIAPPARWWKQVAATMGRAASNLRDGEISRFETIAKYVTLELVYIVWVERNKGKVGGSEDIALFPLRITMTFRPEDGN